MMPHPIQDAVLRVDRLSVVYPGGVTALRDTSIAFRRGEFTVLLGLSGAGKSTLLRSLNRLVTPTGGSVTSELGELGSGSALRQHRRRTAMIFQHHQLIERQSALANVLTGRLAFHNTLRSLFPLPRADQEIALMCLARVGLADKALSRVDKLSGGQQQRVGIARALAQQPAIILADEPVASLDPATSVRVLGLLRDICKEDGITVIVSLHQLEYARRFADRVVGLADSQIVFDAAPSELTDAQLERIYAGRSTTQPANTPAEPPVMLEPSLEMSR
ncbi:phosphonate ABC transporter ATP-binding protein [Klebsiella pneumoniae]|uniref:phosphonate ABC transporter ATP-binding protein n=1 Tax=Klebsiella pneumoniae TaxID=573 RepID=UPI0021D161C2|nr:phosphonate ABC transporter ATP-binding protein [Klebsiella pneumoniae]MCU6545681.1 phosphonate ABC transporter ATP-binding protein [Klebsiella pneumoniae]